MAATVGGLVVYALWGFGAFAMIGFPGYARAGKLEEVAQKQDVQLQLTLAAEICRLNQLRMEAPTLELFNVLGTTLENRQTQYAAVNGGQRYRLEECSTFRPPPR